MIRTGFLSRRSSTLDDFEATMSQLLRPCRITHRLHGNFRSNVLHGRMPNVGLTMLNLNAETRIAVEAHPSLTLLQIPIRGSFESIDQSGRRHKYVSGSCAQLVKASSPLDLVLAPTTRLLIIDLDDRRARPLGLAADLHFARPNESTVSLDRGAGRALDRFVRFLIAEIENDQRSMYSGLFAEMLERSLIAALGAAVAGPHEKTDPSPMVPPHVRRAERFMAANLSRSITVEDIADAAGTSARTLFRGFRDARRDTPLGSLKSMRLDRVHAELSQNIIGRGEITRVAMAWGFNHMGLFAADYRKRFGVAPSKTVLGAYSRR